ncbi:MAG: hypothetical protein WCK70_06470 [Chloroflexales bacterium]
MTLPLILVLLIALSALLWWRRQGAAPATARPATARPGRRRLLPLSRSERLALWLQESASSNAADLPPNADAELVAWVATLTRPELRNWERAARAFFAEAGFDLALLWSHTLDQDADLRAEISTAVLIYSLTYARARRIAPTVAAVKALHRWRGAPRRARQRRFGDALHTALVRRGLLSINPDLFLAPERRRRNEAFAAIKNLDVKQHSEVRTTVAMMLAGTPITPLPTPSQHALPSPVDSETEAPDGDQLSALHPRAA